MSTSDEAGRWTLDADEHPAVSRVLSSTCTTSQWYDDLETTPSDAVTGKLLCVVAGLAIARAVVERQFPDHKRFAESIALLHLAETWIDDPSDERFEEIKQFLFDDDPASPESDGPLNVVWGALRIVTSSVGNYEAGWALSIVVEDAAKANLDGLEIARQAVQSRTCNG